MRINDFMLGDAFEVSGQWWLPERPDEQVYGTLRYSATKIELELSGELETDSPEDLDAGVPTFSKHECILGLTHDRQKFTLLQAHATSLSSTITYNANHLIAEKHIPALTELKFQKVSFYCLHLDTFIARQIFSTENDGVRENFKSSTLTYHQPEKLSWRIKEIKSALDFQTDLKWKGRRAGLSHEMHAQSFVTITPDSSQELDWYLRQVWRFCYFLTLVTDEIVSPTGIQVYLDDEELPGWHLYTVRTERETDENSALVFLYHLAHLIDNFEPMLEKWFSVSDTLLDSIHLMMDAHRKVYHNTQGRFLLLAHAVEVVSRATTQSEYTSKEAYDEVIGVMNDAIPQTVTSDHRMSLKSKIKYGNEFAFHKRIKVLLETLSDEEREIVCKVPKDFARGIADTRNYYTHFTDELRPKALPPTAMYWASEKLSFLMRIVLFRYLGLGPDLIVQRMRQHPSITQRIYLSKEHVEVMSEKS